MISFEEEETRKETNEENICCNNKNIEDDGDHGGDDNDAADNKEEPMGLADAMMMRGERIRALRRMMEEEEEEEDGEDEEELMEDVTMYLSTGERVLLYESFLQHQRYYDDLKHVDYNLIAYEIKGNNNNKKKNDDGDRCESSTGMVVVAVEQDKSLGKGGLCWDAAFILADHLLLSLSNDDDIASNTEADGEGTHMDLFQNQSILELGSGTGLCGILLAAGLQLQGVRGYHVELTDLPELLPILTRNMQLNFVSRSTDSTNGHTGTERFSPKDLQIVFGAKTTTTEGKLANRHDLGMVTINCCSSRVLRWGHPEDYFRAEDEPNDKGEEYAPSEARRTSKQKYDVLLGADVVASLYDPIALAETMWDLTHASSTVWISYKGRLTEPHVQFEERLGELFGKVERIRPISRNRNPAVWILKATNRNESRGGTDVSS